MTAPPRAILWDVMDTLVVDPFRHIMPSFFGMTLAELLEHKHPTAWARFERSEHCRRRLGDDADDAHARHARRP